MSKLLLIRTSSSPEKQCAPPKAALQIRLENQAKQRGRRFAPPSPPLVQNRQVLYWCLYFTKLAPIFKIADNVPRAERVVMRN
jgi:hypothetical protein